MKAPHVFLGKAVSKKYTSDQQHYDIKFQVLRTFKGESEKEYFEFRLRSEGEYTGEFSSCDWNVEQGEYWIIYTYWREGELRFGNTCSNSRWVKDPGIEFREDIIKENWEDFRKSDFIMTSLDGGFERSQPRINLDSLLRPYYRKDYGDEYGDNIAMAAIDIDTTGGVLNSTYHIPGNVYHPFVLHSDTIFNLSEYTPLQVVAEPNTEFSKDMMRELSKVKQWDPILIKGTKEAVRFRKSLHFYKKKDTIIVKY